MEFHTEREQALYATLQRVLHNHVGTHRLSYHETLAACISVLGYVLYVMLESWDEVPGLVASTTAELQERVEARALQGQRALAPFPHYDTHTPLSPRYYELGTALATFLTTSGLEHDMSVTATWRAYLALVADVLALPLHDNAQTLAEVHAAIAALANQLPTVMRMWDEEGQEESG
jgi:hypothetical protein